MQGEERSVAQQLGRGDVDGTPMTDAERVLLKLCGLLTQAAHRMTAAEIEQVRAAGWTDEQIGEAVYVTAMFAMFNRIADAFGLEDPNYQQTLPGDGPATAE